MKGKRAFNELTSILTEEDLKGIVESRVLGAPFIRMITRFRSMFSSICGNWNSSFSLMGLSILTFFSVAEDYGDIAYELYFRHFVFTESM